MTTFHGNPKIQNPKNFSSLHPWNVSDFIFLASAYEGDWPVLSLALSSSLSQCTVSVLIEADAFLDTSENAEPLETHFYPCRDFHPEAITLRKKDAIVTAIVIPKFVNGVTNQIEFVDEVKPLQLTIGQLIYQQTRNSVVAHFADVMNSYKLQRMSKMWCIPTILFLPILFLPLLPSVGFSQTSGAAFCCEGWVFGPSGSFGYYAAKGLFGCGSISMEWSTLWAAFLADGPPFQILHLSQVLLFCPWLSLEPRLLKRCYISLQNEWMNEWMYLTDVIYSYLTDES